ncbi:MAG TPA: hypothetical protein VGI54_06700, partial [Solirubrobacteraceae bacterium]
EEDEGPILAVDVSGRSRPPVLLEPSRRDRRRGRGEDPVPGMREALGRAITLGGIDPRLAGARTGALTLEPDIDGIGRLEFHQIDAARDAGRRAARRALDSVRREVE